MDNRYNKRYLKFHFSTLHSIEMKVIRDKWYKNNIKIIPNDFAINKTNLLHLWIGDGS